MNGICKKTNIKGAKMKALNTMSGIGFMGMKKVWFHWVTSSEKWLLGQSTLEKPCNAAAAVLHIVRFKAYFLVSCSEQ